MTRILMSALASLVLGAGAASAHAFLKTATPAVGSTLQKAPPELVIDFTERVEPKFSTVAAQDASGASVVIGDVHLMGDATHLAIRLAALKPGLYTVTWHATAVDTHKTEGSYTFTIAP